MLTLEGFLNESLDGGPRGYGSTIRKAVQALQQAGIGFAVAGSLAYSYRIEPTYTKDADFLVEASTWRAAHTALRAAGFTIEGNSMLSRATDPETGVWIDLMFGVGDPEESARESAPTEKLFQVSVQVVNTNYILWMYLLSDQGRHHDRGVEILRRRQADLTWLARALKYDGDLESLKVLQRWVIESRRPATGWKPRARR